jgi:hypothetical protein
MVILEKTEDGSYCLVLVRVVTDDGLHGRKNQGKIKELAPCISKLRGIQWSINVCDCRDEALGRQQDEMTDFLSIPHFPMLNAGDCDPLCIKRVFPEENDTKHTPGMGPYIAEVSKGESFRQHSLTRCRLPSTDCLAAAADTIRMPVSLKVVLQHHRSQTCARITAVHWVCINNHSVTMSCSGQSHEMSTAFGSSYQCHFLFPWRVLVSKEHRL